METLEERNGEGAGNPTPHVFLCYCCGVLEKTCRMSEVSTDAQKPGRHVSTVIHSSRLRVALQTPSAGVHMCPGGRVNSRSIPRNSSRDPGVPSAAEASGGQALPTQPDACCSHD